MDNKEKKIHKYTKAISEAKRFIKRADEAKGELMKGNLSYMTGCKETAAAKRASMDLTRVLAELRKT